MGQLHGVCFLPDCYAFVGDHDSGALRAQRARVVLIGSNLIRPPCEYCSYGTGAVPAEDLLGQGIFVETYPGAPVSETTVDDDSRQAADAVTGGRHHDGGIVHITNFDIVLGACQKLDQVHSLGAAGAAGCKDLDFSALSHVVFRVSDRFCWAWRLWRNARGMSNFDQNDIFSSRQKWSHSVRYGVDRPRSREQTPCRRCQAFNSRVPMRLTRWQREIGRVSYRSRGERRRLDGSGRRNPPPARSRQEADWSCASASWRAQADVG